MLSDAQRHEYLVSLERLPMALEMALRGLRDEQLDVAVAVGEWTIRQLVHHMADAHFAGYASMKALLAKERPRLNGWVADGWVSFADNDLAVDVSLWILRGVHARWTRVLRSLPESAWLRSAVNSEGKEVLLDDLLERYARAGRESLEKILALRRRFGWG